MLECRLQLFFVLPSAASSGKGNNASDSTDIAIAATTAAATARCASNLAITAAIAGYCGLAYSTAAAANAAASAASAAAYGDFQAAAKASSSAYDLAMILQPEDYGLTPGKSIQHVDSVAKQRHMPQSSCLQDETCSDEAAPCIHVRTLSLLQLLQVLFAVSCRLRGRLW